MYKTKLIGLVLMLILSQNVYGQTPLRRVKPIAKIPFKALNGGILVLKFLVTGNYTDTLSFIFDTGSGGISMDSTIAANLKLPSVNKGKQLRGIGGVKAVPTIENLPFSWGPKLVDTFDFYVNDYSALASYYGERIDGIIGVPLMSKYVIKIDYDENQMYIYPKGIYKYGPGKIIPIQIAGIPSLEATIEDNNTHRGNYIFDTGGGLHVMLIDEFNDEKNIIKPTRKKVNTFAEGLGGRTKLEITIAKKFTVAGFKFYDVPVYLFKDSLGVLNYPVRKGIVGNEIFRRFNTILNFAQNEVHILPNKKYFDKFDYGYTGLDLYLQDEKIIVGGVAENSPAAKAGLLENDIIVAVNNLFNASLSEYRDILDRTDESFKIIINRKGSLSQIKLRPSSIR
jgi:hypothetical protein